MLALLRSFWGESAIIHHPVPLRILLSEDAISPTRADDAPERKSAWDKKEERK